MLAQIPPCLLEKMRSNEKKNILTIHHKPFNNKGYCCMASPLLEGCLVDWNNSAGFLRNGIFTHHLLFYEVQRLIVHVVSRGTTKPNWEEAA